MAGLRWIYRLLIGGWLIVGVACGRMTGEDRLYEIGFSQCAADSWRMKMNQEMLREKIFYDNLSLEIRTAQSNNAQQIEDIRYFIQKRIDLLIVCPNTSEALVPVIEEAKRAGIKIIVADRKVLTDSYDAFVGANNYQIGQAVGSYVKSLLPHGGRVVEITGNMASSPAVERHNGFVSVVKGIEKVDILSSADGQWVRHAAFEGMLSILEQHPEIDVVFAHNDEMALGAWNAARSLGREKEIKFIGIDALPGKDNGVELVADDVLVATFQYPSGAEEIFRVAMDLLQGCTPPRETVLNTAVIDKSNVRVMELQGNYISQQDKKIELLREKVNHYTKSYDMQHTMLLMSILLVVVVVTALVSLTLALRSKGRLNRQLIDQNTSISAQKIQLEEQRDKLIELSRQVEETSQAKLKFFTNVSHEFRTPLTLIADPLERLLSGKESEETRRYLLQLIDRNVHILLRLVNQTLEFRRYENGRSEVMMVEGRFDKLIHKWNESFTHLAENKHISFELEIQPKADYSIVLDAEKIEHVYYNLMHNAMKYTPESGLIRVTLSTTQLAGEEALQLAIFNSGSQIPTESLEKIFDRFYQLHAPSMGTGIGLAIVRAFVEMHRGEIVASSTEEGTTFTLRLPRHQELTEQSDGEQEDDLSLTDPLATTEKPLLLVVDDNSEVISYIRNLFAESFLVLSASDGKEGLERARASLPDIILLDVMMDGMDGMECCRQLKEDVRTCHIPVILLTARSEESQRAEGYECGADSYITKPFSSKTLWARIDNLMENRRRLQQTLIERESFDEEPTANADSEIEESHEDRDRTFIIRLNQYIMANIDNPSLDVESIGKYLALSRMQFYRKIKALTGFSPNEYVRMVRLKRAETLLLNTSKSISEICYETGFTSPSYFAKCFRNYTGDSPADYKRRRQEENTSPQSEK